MSVCTRLSGPCNLLKASMVERGNAFNIGSANGYQFMPFSARPYIYGNQLKTEDVNADAGKGDVESEENSTETGKDDKGPQENSQDIGKEGDGSQQTGHDSGKDADNTAAGGIGQEGSQGNGGNGRKGNNWNEYDNYLLYVLSEHRKAGSLENSKLLEANEKLRTELQVFRFETTEKILKVQVTLSRAAFQIILALLVALLALVEFMFPWTPAGKSIAEYIKKKLGGECDE